MSLGLDEDIKECSKNISIILLDGSKIDLDERVAREIKLFREILDTSVSETNIYLQREISVTVMNKIIEYVIHHMTEPAKEIDRPLYTNNLSSIVTTWDNNFIQMEDAFMFEIINTANYLDIPKLVELGCAKIATELYGKSADEMKKRFNFENNLTPEEIEKIKEENSWVYELELN